MSIILTCTKYYKIGGKNDIPFGKLRGIKKSCHSIFHTKSGRCLAAHWIWDWI